MYISLLIVLYICTTTDSSLSTWVLGTGTSQTKVDLNKKILLAVGVDLGWAATNTLIPRVRGPDGKQIH